MKRPVAAYVRYPSQQDTLRWIWRSSSACFCRRVCNYMLHDSSSGDKKRFSYNRSYNLIYNPLRTPMVVVKCTSNPTSLMVEVSVPQIKHLSLVVACQKQHTLGGPGNKQVYSSTVLSYGIQDWWSLNEQIVKWKRSDKLPGTHLPVIYKSY